MKKLISLLLVVCLVAATIVFMPSDLVKAGDITGTKEDAELMLRAINESRSYCYRFFDKKMDIDSFRPGDKMTYGEFAQWLYYSINMDETKYPSKKKAINWLRSVFYELALQYPDYAYQFLDAFTDGKYAKFSYKKQASWEWLRSVVYVLTIYQNGVYGRRILDQVGFNFDATVIDLVKCGTDKDGNIQLIQNYYHDRWVRSFAKKGATKPIRIEALEFIYGLFVSRILIENRH